MLPPLAAMNKTAEMTWLRDTIADGALVFDAQKKIFGSEESKLSWIFDIKNISLQPHVLTTIAKLFWSQHKELPPCQIGGMETAAIPLITAIVLEGHRRGKQVSGFYIRKSRKKTGLMKQIEGSMTNNPIILVDDLINAGKSMARQIELLKLEGYVVHSIFAVVRFREDEEYRHILNQGISLYTLFALPDFSLKYLETPPVKHLEFKHGAYFKSKNASYAHVRQKSTPLLSGNRIYFATDSGHVWCLKKETLAVIWHKKLGLFTKQHVFTSPLLLGGTLIVTSYNGAVYQLDARSGEIKKRITIGDRITATPLLFNDQHILIVGTDNHTSGLIIALNANTLQKLWEYPTSAPIVGTGLVFDINRFVINDISGTFYWGAADGITSLQKWKHFGSTLGSIGLDTHRKKMFWGTMKGEVLEASIQRGRPKVLTRVDGGIVTTPLAHDDMLLISSLDGNIYCLDIKSRKLQWKFETYGRVFASPVVHNNIVYIGSNDNRLYAIDVHTGKECGFFQVTERVTSPVVIDNEDTLLLPTYANELYRLTIKHNV